MSVAWCARYQMDLQEALPYCTWPDEFHSCEKCANFEMVGVEL